MNDQVELKPGDVVRVVDPKLFISSLEKKIADRDAVVLWVGPTAHGMFKGQACVQFQKRSGRGKEFQEVMRIRDLVLKRGEE